jgi:hypothetical protein
MKTYGGVEIGPTALSVLTHGIRLAVQSAACTAAIFLGKSPGTGPYRTGDAGDPSAGVLTEKKGKDHCITGHEGPERKERYSSTLCLASALDRGGMLKPRPGRFTPRERDTAPAVQEGGWASVPVWTGAENLASTGIRIPDRPAVANSYTDHAITVQMVQRRKKTAIAQE